MQDAHFYVNNLDVDDVAVANITKLLRDYQEGFSAEVNINMED